MADNHQEDEFPELVTISQYNQLKEENERLKNELNKTIDEFEAFKKLVKKSEDLKHQVQAIAKSPRKRARQ